MKTRIARREFLKTTSAAAGAIASAAAGPPSRPQAASARRAVTISSASYPRAGDYPLQATPVSRVTIADRFWKPRLNNNATVTIPLLAGRQSEGGSTQQTADMADHIDFADNGRLHYDDKDFPRRVRAVRAF